MEWVSRRNYFRHCSCFGDLEGGGEARYDSACASPGVRSLHFALSSRLALTGSSLAASSRVSVSLARLLSTRWRSRQRTTGALPVHFLLPLRLVLTLPGVSFSLSQEGPRQVPRGPPRYRPNNTFLQGSRRRQGLLCRACCQRRPPVEGASQHPSFRPLSLNGIADSVTGILHRTGFDRP